AAPTYNVAPRRLRTQLEGLLARGFRPWPLGKILDHAREGRAVPPRVFAVTFDDGYENFHGHAWPVLRAVSVPPAVFRVPGYLGGDAPFPCDEWRWAGSARVPAETWRPLFYAQCADIVRDGLVELGSHTHTHAVFRGRPRAFSEDLAASVALLRDRFGV